MGGSNGGHLCFFFHIQIRKIGQLGKMNICTSDSLMQVCVKYGRWVMIGQLCMAGRWGRPRGRPHSLPDIQLMGFLHHPPTSDCWGRPVAGMRPLLHPAPARWRHCTRQRHLAAGLGIRRARRHARNVTPRLGAEQGGECRDPPAGPAD